MPTYGLFKTPVISGRPPSDNQTKVFAPEEKRKEKLPSLTTRHGPKPSTGDPWAVGLRELNRILTIKNLTPLPGPKLRCSRIRGVWMRPRLPVTHFFRPKAMSLYLWLSATHVASSTPGVHIPVTDWKRREEVRARCSGHKIVRVHRDTGGRSYWFGDCFLASSVGLVGRTIYRCCPAQASSTLG